MSSRNLGSGKINSFNKTKNLCGTTEDPELPKDPEKRRDKSWKYNLLPDFRTILTKCSNFKNSMVFTQNRSTEQKKEAQK